MIYFAIQIQFDSIFPAACTGLTQQVLPKGIPTKLPVLMDVC